MDFQTIAVMAIAALCVVFLIKEYARPVKNGGSCGCGCSGDTCSSGRASDCGDKK